MWHPDIRVHELHVKLIQYMAEVKDDNERHVEALKIIEVYSAISTLSDEKFRAFAMVVAQLAQDPLLRKD